MEEIRWRAYDRMGWRDSGKGHVEAVPPTDWSAARSMVRLDELLSEGWTQSRVTFDNGQLVYHLTRNA